LLNLNIAICQSRTCDEARRQRGGPANHTRALVGQRAAKLERDRVTPAADVAPQRHHLRLSAAINDVIF
jgi:hypothetical protein